MWRLSIRQWSGPSKRLKGFQKVYLRPGETKRLSITLDRRCLAYYTAEASTLLASGTPRTTIVLGEEPLRRGVSTSVRIRQAGPVSFQSLRANLICERIERAAGAKSRSITYPHQSQPHRSYHRRPGRERGGRFAGGFRARAPRSLFRSTIVNEAFLRQLTRQQRGTSVLLSPNDDLVRPIAILGSRLSRPALTDLALDGGWELADTGLPDIHAGQVIFASMRAASNLSKINVAGRDASGATAYPGARDSDLWKLICRSSSG